MEKYEAWIGQATEDLLWGEDSLRGKHYAQTCFISQQIGEKVMKALAYFRGHEVVKSHSIVKMANLLGVN